VCRSGTIITLAAELAISSGCFPKRCEHFESSLLHSVSQVQSLCVTLPLVPSKIGWAPENLHLHFTTKELACGHDLTCRVLWASSVPKVLQVVPQECRKSTLLEVIQASPCFHINRRRSSIVHLDIMTKVRISRMRVYKDNSIHE
jgi:hypothetical protein